MFLAVHKDPSESTEDATMSNNAVNSNNVDDSLGYAVDAHRHASSRSLGKNSSGAPFQLYSMYSTMPLEASRDDLCAVVHVRQQSRDQLTLVYSYSDKGANPD